MLEFLNPFLDLLLSPLLNLGVLTTVLIISFVVSVLITIIYKYTTNQSLMKQLKEEIKNLQSQLKTLQDNPEKLKETQSKMMQINMKVMMESFKPMIYYIIPTLLIFGWMSNSLYYEPLMQNEAFSIDVLSKNTSLKNYEGLELIEKKGIELEGNRAERYEFKGKNGEYFVVFNINNEEYKKKVIIDNKKYHAPIEKINNVSIITNNKKTILFDLGFMQLGWLGTYIISSIIFSSLLRKWMNVY